MVFGATCDGAGAAPLVSRLQPFVFEQSPLLWEAVGMPGRCTGGCGYWQQVGRRCGGRRDPAFLDGPPRAVAAVRPLDDEVSEHCYLAASTVQRWLDAAGQVAQASVRAVAGHCPERELVTDGLWARLRARVMRVYSAG